MDPDPNAQISAQRFAALEQTIQEQQNRLSQILERLDSLTATRPNPVLPESLPTAHPTGQHSGSTPHSDSKPNRNTTPAVPPYYDGDRTKGRVFWNAVQFYMSACAAQFDTNDAAIIWVLSYMNSDRAAIFVDTQLNKYKAGERAFEDWEEFRSKFVEEFFPQTEREDALNLLFSGRYAQGSRTVEDYVDSFNVLIARAQFKDSFAISNHFRLGFVPIIQAQFATLEN